jgi:uncharacterized LabA/DUF88 family protein
MQGPPTGSPRGASSEAVAQQRLYRIFYYTAEPLIIDAGAQDVTPKILQMGVDVRIGLDIASLALKRLVSAVFIVTGDSDLVPAMRLARREGMRVYLDTLGSTSVRAELKIHADFVL